MSQSEAQEEEEKKKYMSKVQVKRGEVQNAAPRIQTAPTNNGILEYLAAQRLHHTRDVNVAQSALALLPSLPTGESSNTVYLYVG